MCTALLSITIYFLALANVPFASNGSLKTAMSTLASPWADAVSGEICGRVTVYSKMYIATMYIATYGLVVFSAPCCTHWPSKRYWMEAMKQRPLRSISNYTLDPVSLAVLWEFSTSIIIILAEHYTLYRSALTMLITHTLVIITSYTMLFLSCMHKISLFLRTAKPTSCGLLTRMSPAPLLQEELPLLPVACIIFIVYAVGVLCY